MSKLILNKGDRFGKLTYLSEAKKRFLPSGQQNRFALCKCDCGKTKEVRLLHLVRLRTKSCGCLSRTANGRYREALYLKWKGIKDRCKEAHIDRHIYFERGISVCSEWENDYEAFKKWCVKNGYRKDLEIDRINNEKGYSPDNCRFVTRKENANNRRDTFFVNYKGEKVAIMILLERLDKLKSLGAIRGRILRGWDHDRAIDTPIRNGNYRQSIL